MTAPESLPQAEVAANKALQLDPNLAMAHHALAWVNYALKWDFPAAEKEFQRAIDLSPNDVTGHLWYGMFLAWQNRTQESLAEMQRAKQLDPFSSIVNGLTMTPLLSTRQYDRLIDSASESLQSNPNDPLLMWLLASAYEQKGRTCTPPWKRHTHSAPGTCCTPYKLSPHSIPTFTNIILRN